MSALSSWSLEFLEYSSGLLKAMLSISYSRLSSSLSSKYILSYAGLSVKIVRITVTKTQRPKQAIIILAMEHFRPIQYPSILSHSPLFIRFGSHNNNPDLAFPNPRPANIRSIFRFHLNVNIINTRYSPDVIKYPYKECKRFKYVYDIYLVCWRSI